MEHELPTFLLDQLEQLIILLTQDLTVSWLNKSALTYFGSDTTVLHTSLYELLNRCDPKHSTFPDLAQLKKVPEALLKYQTEAFHTFKEGHYVSWHFFIKQPKEELSYAFFLIGKDITHDKKLEEDYQEMENRLDSVIESMPGNYWWKDLNGIYRGYNHVLLKMLGLGSKADVVGKNDYELPWKDQAANLYANDDIVLKTGKPRITEEKVLSQTGQLMTFIVTKVPLRNAKGEVIGTIGSSVDITAQKNLENDLRLAKEAAEAANEAKTEFLSNMRHDLRTPFTGILGLADLMAKEETDPEKKENLSYIAESGQALLNHLNEILEFVQVESGQLPILEKPFDIYELLDRTLNILLPSTKNKHLNFTFNISKDLPQFLLGDAVRTQRVLINLISNAIKFTEKGEVKVDILVADKLDTKIVLNFVIEDTGMGIPEDKQDIIFERFNRLTSSYSGVYPGKGLGLKMVRQFLEEIGGQVYLTSELSKGTVFKVLIPYQLPLLPQVAEENKSGQQKQSEFIKKTPVSVIGKDLIMKSKLNPKNKKPLNKRRGIKSNKILLVEDHQIAARIARTILSELGCEVDIAETGKIALELIEKNHYDLIFMDIGLPDIDGCAVTKQIRLHSLKQIAKIPIVALTAHAESDEKQRCLDVGMSMVITKPLTKKWAESVLDNFIPQREKQKRQIKQVEQTAQTGANAKLAEKIVDIEYAKALLGGNEAVIQEMLTMLVDSLPEEVKALEAAYKQKNWEELRGLAHKLKGGASYCGTLRLKSVCTELDSYIKSGATARIPELYQHLLDEIENLQQFIIRRIVDE